VNNSSATGSCPWRFNLTKNANALNMLVGAIMDRPVILQTKSHRQRRYFYISLGKSHNFCEIVGGRLIAAPTGSIVVPAKKQTSLIS